MASLVAQLAKNLPGRPFSREGLGGQSQGVSLSISFMVARQLLQLQPLHLCSRPANILKTKSWGLNLAEEDWGHLFGADMLSTICQPRLVEEGSFMCLAILVVKVKM